MSPQEFLQWLASGLGANVVVSFLVERWPWFQNLASDTKKFLSIVGTAVIALAAYGIMIYVPATFWASINPYWQIIVAVVGMFVGTQVFHKFDRAG
jgi:hypothetical protein